MLRMKGFVAVAGKPMRLLVQGVGERFRQQFDRPWRPGEDAAGRLVVIGEDGLDRAAIAAALVLKTHRAMHLLRIDDAADRRGGSRRRPRSDARRYRLPVIFRQRPRLGGGRAARMARCPCGRLLGSPPWRRFVTHIPSTFISIRSRPGLVSYWFVCLADSTTGDTARCELAAAARRDGFDLVLVPGDGRSDARLAELSTLPSDFAQTIWRAISRPAAPTTSAGCSPGSRAASAATRRLRPSLRAWRPAGSSPAPAALVRLKRRSQSSSSIAPMSWPATSHRSSRLPTRWRRAGRASSPPMLRA